MDFLFYIACFTSVLSILVVFDTLRGISSIKFIKHISARHVPETPKVSIIVPALNEEKTIESALSSLLSLDYDPYEIIVVNDRSTDATQSVIDRIAQEHSRVEVVQITKLPNGWIGKNHALQYGAQRATGDYLLFTDADVVMEKTVLKRTIKYAVDNRLDHVALLYDPLVSGGLLNMIILETFLGIFYISRPWNTRNPKSKSYTGVGAFNMVKRSVYEEIGMHQSVAMSPLDDLMLGRLIKRQGFRQELLFGYRMVSVEWYPSIKDMISGTSKNAFALFNFNLALVVATTITQILFSIWPLIALFLTSGATQLLNGLILVTRITGYAYLAPRVSIKRRYLVWSFLSTYVCAYSLWKATLKTILNRGIVWRGTFYSLKDLRANRPEVS